MVKQIIADCFITFCLSAGSAFANGLVVNEVMVNEPGGRVSLEWFELHNTSQNALPLLDDTVIVGVQVVPILSAMTLAPFEYLVVARDTNAFEEHWGDSSGVWGDNPQLENYTLTQLSFSLKNTAGALTVANDTTVSTLTWPTAGADGVSWERIRADIDTVSQSTAPGGATPGAVNSVAQSAQDWAITTLEIRATFGLPTGITVTIRNVGAQALPAACMLVYNNPVLSASAPYGMLGDSLRCEPIPPLRSSDSATINLTVNALLFAGGIYDTIGITIAGNDQRTENNTRIVVIPGSGPSPVTINEFLPNPQTPLQSEWVELKNTSLIPIDLNDWSLGDKLGFGALESIGAVSKVIQPGGYMVIAQDPIDVAFFYNLSVTPFFANPWRALNNDGDILRLKDAFGFSVDSVSYAKAYANNVSWSKSEEEQTNGLWGRSARSGGTPNDSNQTLLNPTNSGLAVSIDPNPFSPDGDGLDETAHITLDAPDGGNLTVTIYDSRGERIKRLFDGAPFSGVLDWDGTADSGRRVPIGLYIVYVAIENSVSVKKSIVVAR